MTDLQRTQNARKKVRDSRHLSSKGAGRGGLGVLLTFFMLLKLHLPRVPKVPEQGAHRSGCRMGNRPFVSPQLRLKKGFPLILLTVALRGGGHHFIVPGLGGCHQNFVTILGPLYSYPLSERVSNDNVLPHLDRGREPSSSKPGFFSCHPPCRGTALRQNQHLSPCSSDQPCSRPR